MPKFTKGKNESSRLREEYDKMTRMVKDWVKEMNQKKAGDGKNGTMWREFVEGFLDYTTKIITQRNAEKSNGLHQEDKNRKEVVQHGTEEEEWGDICLNMTYV